MPIKKEFWGSSQLSSLLTWGFLLPAVKTRTQVLKPSNEIICKMLEIGMDLFIRG
jgi:hypothetical protein